MLTRDTLIMSDDPTTVALLGLVTALLERQPREERRKMLAELREEVEAAADRDLDDQAAKFHSAAETASIVLLSIG